MTRIIMGPTADLDVRDFQEEKGIAFTNTLLEIFQYAKEKLKLEGTTTIYSKCKKIYFNNVIITYC